MQAYQIRLIEERDELYKKLTKLEDFLNSDNLVGIVDFDERERLIEQKHYMRKYYEILVDRIEAFGGAE